MPDAISSARVHQPPPPPPLLADVVVPRRLHRSFTYLVPGHLRERLEVGSVVTIPFGPSTLQGIVVSLSSALPQGSHFNAGESRDLREILALGSEARGLTLSHEALDLARYLSEYYVAPIGQCTRLLLPPARSVEGAPLYALTEPGRDALQQERRLSETGREVLHRLAKSARGMTASSLRRALGGSVAGALRDLAKKRWVEKRNLERSGRTQSGTRMGSAPAGGPAASKFKGAVPGPQTPMDLPLQPLPDPLPGWDKHVSDALDAQQGSTLLLRAPVSQRWACLLQACEACLKRGGNAIMVTGEAEQAARLAGYAEARWGEDAALLHGGLSTRVRAEVWDRIHQGYARLVVGTRSAVFAPLPSLGLICVDGEEDTSLKEEQEPRYHAREVAAERARLSRAVLILGAQGRSVGSDERLPDRSMTFVVPPQPSSRPCIQMVDLRQLGAGTILSKPLLDGIDDTLARGSGVILYHNRKGFAPSLMCRDCGAVPHCTRCSLALTFYRSASRLMCHYCGARAEALEVCPSCRAVRLEPLGFGTERLEAEVRTLWPAARVLRIDRSTVRREGDARLARLEAGRAQIVIGTQLLFTSLTAQPVGLVGIPFADSGLHLPDYRAAERTFAALSKAVALAGAEGTGGRVIIQTYLPGHHVLQAIVHGDPSGFYDNELAARRALGYPPFTTLISLRVSGKNPERVRDAARRWGQDLERCASSMNPEVGAGEVPGVSRPDTRASGPRLSILGPVPATVKQLRDRHRWHLLIKAVDGDLARRIVKQSLERLEGHPGRRELKFEVDVDPLEL